MTLLPSLDDMGILKDLFTSHIFNHICVVSSPDVLEFYFVPLFCSCPKTKRVLLLRTAEHELGEEAKSCVFTTLNMSLFFVCFSSLTLFFCKYHKRISLFLYAMFLLLPRGAAKVV